MKSFSALVALAAVVVATNPHAAESQTERVCLQDLFIKGYEELRPSTVPELAPQLEKEGERSADQNDKDLRGAITGTTTDTTDLGSAVTNFLSRFALSLDTAQLNDEGQTLALDLGSLLVSKVENFKIQTVVNEAKLFEPLKMALPEATRDERAEELSGMLQTQDDVSYIASWKLGKKNGRNFEDHRQLLERLFGDLREAVDSSADLIHEFQHAARQLDYDHDGCVEADPVDAERIRQEFLEKGRRLAKIRESAEATAKENRLDQFYKLVNNQPQKILSFTLRQREELAGPDETMAKFSWEYGLKNINKLKSKCKDEDPFYICYKEFIDDNKASIDGNDRFSLAFEWVDRDDYEITLDDGFLFALPGAETYTATFTYGRYLWVDPESGETGRIDASASYEHPEGDPMRKERFLASATYTHKLTDDISTVVGFAWADKPEFLTGVDEDDKITSRLGLIYKVSRKKKGNGQ